MTHLHVTEHGPTEGTPDQTVVLLSSIATTHETWNALIPELAKRFRVVTVDHRGHGQSETAPVAPGSTTVEDLCQDITQALDSVGVNRFHIVGLSLGGALAQWLAAYSGRVEKAVFCATATFLGGEERWTERTTIAREQGMGALADAFIEAWFTEGFRASHPVKVNEVREMILRIDAEGYAQNGDALAGWDFADQLGKITCPVLTVAGKDDAGTGPEQLAEIAAGVSGPVQSAVIDGSHQVAVENPEAFNRVVKGFLGA